MLVYNEEKYNALHSIIDFFSQNLHLDQIVEYGFNIYNSLETPIRSSIYILNKETNSYERRFIYGAYSNATITIPKAFNHDSFAVRNGFFLLNPEIQLRYFSKDILDSCQVESVMPLIIDDLLFGFIFTSHREPQTHMGEAFLSRFNFLLNLSLEKASRYIEREHLRKEIDKRIFNLNTLSHTVKLLLSELSLPGLLRLTVDVIQETCPNCTAGIGLKSHVESKIEIGTYSTVHCFKVTDRTLRLKTPMPVSDKILLSVSDDYALLNKQFENAEVFLEMGVHYVLLLNHEGVGGVLLIAQKTLMPLTPDVRDRFYDVAGILMIGIRNAKQFQIISEQKEHLDQSIKVMNRMNIMLKDINSSETFEELIDQVMSMLNLTFGVKSAFLVDEKGIMMSIEEEALYPECHYDFSELFTDELDVYYTKASALQRYPWLESFFTSFNCLIVAPIKVSQYSDSVIAYLVIAHTKARLHESQVKMIELLTSTVAPIMQHLKQVAYYKSHYIESPKEKLSRIHERYKHDSGVYDMPFYVYTVRTHLKPFESHPFEKMYENRVVSINGYLIVYANELPDVDDAILLKKENPSFDEVLAFLS